MVGVNYKVTFAILAAFTVLFTNNTSALSFDISPNKIIIGRDLNNDSDVYLYKFGIEGWMESLTLEIAPFGIRTMLVEPGFFRTELLTNDSTTYAEPTIDDYAERTKEIVAAWKSMNGKQGGDPAKLADAIVKLVTLKEPPIRFAAGADAVQTFEAKANTLLAQAQAHRELSTSLAYDDA
jgi:short-subunit dehydrogenase